MISADLKDYGTAPWRVVTKNGDPLYQSSKYSKAVAWGTDYASQNPDTEIELEYAGGRWETTGSVEHTCPQVVALGTVTFKLSAGEYLGTIYV